MNAKYMMKTGYYNIGQYMMENHGWTKNQAFAFEFYGIDNPGDLDALPVEAAAAYRYNQAKLSGALAADAKAADAAEARVNAGQNTVADWEMLVAAGRAKRVTVDHGEYGDASGRSAHVEYQLRTLGAPSEMEN